MSLRGALLGFGQVAEKAHAPAWKKLSPQVQIVAIADPLPERRAEAKNHFPQARIYADPSHLLKQEKSCSFVDICTPPRDHARWSCEALGRGFHVLCEKPLALNIPEAHALQKLAERKRRILYTVHNWKHAPILSRAASLLRKKIIGEIRHAQWIVLRNLPARGAADPRGSGRLSSSRGPWGRLRRSYGDPRGSGNFSFSRSPWGRTRRVSGDPKGGFWRLDPRLAGGGILIDHGWHAFYLLLSFLRQPPLSISAHMEFLRQGLEHTAWCWIRFPAATAQIHLTWRSQYRKNLIFLHGTRGILAILDDKIRLRYARPGGKLKERIWKFPEALSSGSAHPEWFSRMLPDFLKGLRHPLRRSGNLREALTTLRLIRKAYRSTQAKRPITF